jgi:hypothetical protein
MEVGAANRKPETREPGTAGEIERVVEKLSEERFGSIDHRSC